MTASKLIDALYVARSDTKVTMIGGEIGSVTIYIDEDGNQTVELHYARKKTEQPQN